MWKRRQFRFNIRALLALTTLFAIPFAIYAHNRYTTARQIDVVNRLKEMGGKMMWHECELDANWEQIEFDKRTFPQWIEKRLGKDSLYSVVSARLEMADEPDDFIRKASELWRLRMLKVPGCKITANSIKPLLTLHQLEWLELFMTSADDQAIHEIAKIKSLKILDLRSTKVTDKCIEDLVSLPSLSQLLIIDTALTEKGIDKLRSAHPECKIVVTKEDLK